MTSKIVATTWWTPATGCTIGAVLIDDQHDGLKGYIGTVTLPHRPEHDDADMIARLGAKLSPSELKGIFPHFF